MNIQSAAISSSADSGVFSGEVNLHSINLQNVGVGTDVFGGNWNGGWGIPWTWSDARGKWKGKRMISDQDSCELKVPFFKSPEDVGQYQIAR